MKKPKTIRPEDAHVVFLAQYLPLHFLSTMQKLKSKVGRLTLVLSESMDMSRDWTPEFANLEVIMQKSLRFRIKHRHPAGFEDAGKLIIPWSTVSDLSALKPDVVITVEVGARTAQALLVQKLLGRFKLIVQVRESEITAKSRGRLRRWVREQILPKVDQVFVNGASGKRHVLGCGVAAQNITVVPSGTDSTVFGKNFRLRGSGSDLRLLYVGQLIPRKGIVPFAAMLAQVARTSERNIELILTGRGPQEAELNRINWPKNVKVRFLGSQPYRSLPSIYAEADVFVMPSLSDEWGLVVNEAMASGLPVLGSLGAQAVEELVKPGKSGWVYQPGDPEDLREAIKSLLETSAGSLSEMGAVARSAALKTDDEFTANAMLSGIKRVLLPSDLPTPSSIDSPTFAR